MKLLITELNAGGTAWQEKNALGMMARSAVEGLATYAIGLGFSHFATEYTRRELRTTNARRIAKQLYAP
jgi:hypothetical protein